MKRKLICAALLLMCVMLSGCSLMREVIFSENREAVENSVQNELALPVAEPNASEMQRSAAVRTGEEAAQRIKDKVTYTVVESHNAYCVVDFTAPDMQAILSEALERLKQEGMQRSEYDDAVEATTSFIYVRLGSAGCPMVTTRVEIPLEDGQPVMDIAAYDAMYGGLITAMQQLETLYGGEG